jgi:hypothetical protein
MKSRPPVNAFATRETTPLERQALPQGVQSTAQVPCEIDRVRLIADLTRILREPSVPEATRLAGLTLVGWLARRMPGEASHALGCDEFTEEVTAEVTIVRSRRP